MRFGLRKYEKASSFYSTSEQFTFESTQYGGFARVEYHLLGCLRAWVIVIKKKKKEKRKKTRRKGDSIIKYIRKQFGCFGFKLLAIGDGKGY